MFPEQPVPKDVGELKSQPSSNLPPVSSIPVQDNNTISVSAKAETTQSNQIPQSVQPEMPVQTKAAPVQSQDQALQADTTGGISHLPQSMPIQQEVNLPVQSTTSASETMASAPSKPQPSPEPQQAFTPAPEPNLIKVTPNIVSTVPDAAQGKKRRKFSINIVGILMKLVFTTIFLAPLLVGGLVVLVSYDLINIGNPLFQKKIQNMFFSLPYFPKPSKYVLETAIENQRNIKSAAFDANFEVSNLENITQGFISPESTKIAVTGYYDTKTPKERKYKLQANVFDVLELEYLNTGARSYLNPQKLPNEVFDYLQLIDVKQRESILNIWVDLGPQVSKDTTVEEEEFMEYFSLLAPKLFSKIKSSEDADLYKYELKLDKALFQELFAYLEDYYKKQGEDVKAINARDIYENNKDIENLTLFVSVDKFDLKFKNISADVQTKVNTSSLTALPADIYLPESDSPSTAGSVDLSFKVDITQKDTNKDFDFSTPTDTKTMQEYIMYVTQVSPLFGMQTAKIEYVSVLSVLETFKQEMLSYYLQNSTYPDNLDPLPSSASFKLMEDEQILYYRKLDLTHWGMFVAIPDPTITYPTLKSDPELGEEKTPGPTREQPYMALIFISNAADSQVQYYSVTEIGNIAGDVVLRKLGDMPELPVTPGEPEDPIIPENPEQPETPGTGECDSPFGCLLD